MMVTTRATLELTTSSDNDGDNNNHNEDMAKKAGVDDDDDQNDFEMWVAPPTIETTMPERQRRL